MIVKTNDEQQYGIITKILKEGTYYKIQCHGELPRVRKCTLIDDFPSDVALSVQDVVLVRFKFGNKKDGWIVCVYGRCEKAQLLNLWMDYQVPEDLVEVLAEEGYDLIPDVTFNDDVMFVVNAEDNDDDSEGKVE